MSKCSIDNAVNHIIGNLTYDYSKPARSGVIPHQYDSDRNIISFSKNLAKDKLNHINKNFRELELRHGDKLNQFILKGENEDFLSFKITVNEDNIDNIAKAENLVEISNNYHNTLKRKEAAKNLTPKSLAKEMLGVKYTAKNRKNPFKGSFTDANGNIYLKINNNKDSDNIIQFVSNKYALSPQILSKVEQKMFPGSSEKFSTVKISVNKHTKTFPLSPIQAEIKAIKSSDLDLNESTEIPKDYKGFRYGNYVQKQKEALSTLQRYVQVLKNKKDNSKEGRLKIARVNKLITGLKNDIKEFSRSTNYYKNYFETFNNEIKSLEHLVRAGDIESLMAVKEYLELLSNVNKVDGGFLSEPNYKIQENPDLTSEEKALIDKLFRDFGSNLDALKSKYQEAIKRATLQAIKDHNEGKGKTEEEIIRIYEEDIKNELADLDIVDLALDAIEENTLGKNLIGEMVFKIYTRSDKLNSKTEFLQRIKNIKDKVKKKLIADGHVADKTFSGPLRTKASFKMFFRGENNQKLASIFSDKWEGFVSYMEGNFQAIDNIVYRPNKTDQDYKKIEELREKAYKNITNKGEFLDISNMPEIVSDPDVKELFGIKDDYQVDEAYRKRIISAIGIAEYNNLVKKQLNKIYDYIAFRDSIVEEFLSRNNVNTIEDLPSEEFNSYFNRVSAHVPMFNAKNKVPKPYINEKGKVVTSVINNSLQNNEYIPDFNYNNGVYMDKKFVEEIYKDSDYYEAWKIFKEGFEYINNNNQVTNKKAPNYTQITSNIDSIQEQIALDKGFISRLSHYTRKFIQSLYSTSNFKGKDKLYVGTAVTTIDKQIKNKISEIQKIVAKRFNIPYEAETLIAKKDQDLTEVYEFLRTAYNIDSVGNENLNSLIRNNVKKIVLNSQELDLFKTLESQVDLTSKLKAKRETENSILFLKNRLEEQHIPGDPKATRKNAIALLDLFIDKKIYGVNNIENTKRDKLISQIGKKEIVNATIEIKDNLLKEKLQLEELIKEGEDFGMEVSQLETELEDINKELKYFDDFIDSNTVSVGFNSIVSATLLKLARFKAFALNVKGQISNIIQGHVAATEMDGIVWKEGNWFKAMSYMRYWKRVSRLSKKQKEDKLILDLLFNRIGVFQNSANDIFDVKKSKLASGTFKVLTNPMALPGEAEKHIQKRHVLALFGDRDKVFIRNAKTGEIEPLFDLDNTKNPLKAFKIENGNLMLTKDYDTAENRATWLDNNSKEFADFFSDSGVVPNAISTINGNYKESSVYFAEKNMGTALLFMFKRWMGQTIKRKFKALNKMENVGKSGLATSTSALTSFVNAANIAGSLNPVGAILPLASAGVVHYAAKYKSKEMSKREILKSLMDVKTIYQSFKDLMVNVNFWQGLYRVPTASLMKSVQLSTRLLYKKGVFTNEQIANMAGATKGIEDAEGREQAIQYFNQLASSLALSLMVTGIRILHHALAYPDDEEDKLDEYGEKVLSDYEKYKKEVNDGKPFWDRVFDSPDMVAYYTFENYSQRILSDINFMYNTKDMAASLIPLKEDRNFKIYSEAFGQLGDIEETYIKGEHGGENKFKVLASKIFLPGLFENGVNYPTFGFNNISKKDWTKDDVLDKSFSKIKDDSEESKTDLEVYENTRKLNREAYKKLLFEKNKDVHKNKKDRDYLIQKELKEVFPTNWKENFNEDGSLKENKKSLVEDLISGPDENSEVPILKKGKKGRPKKSNYNVLF